MKCTFCGEQILEFEPMGNGDTHRECFLRMVNGSAEHINGQCACFRPRDQAVYEPEDITLRESARRAVRALEAKRARAAIQVYGSVN